MTRPPHPCPGIDATPCGTPTPAGTPRCPPCQATLTRRLDARRPNAAARGYDTRWQNTRAAYLAAHPACVTCGQPARHVDHIDGAGPLAPNGHDWTNLQSLCHPCHSRKTATTDGGWGHRTTTTTTDQPPRRPATRPF